MALHERIAALVSACALALASAAAHAQPDYPGATVRLVVPFPAGGSTDIVGRAFAQKMAEEWGRPVIVENRAGAGGLIGSEAVARAAPDGYTILLGSFGTHGVSTSLVKNLAYHPERDFAPVSLLATFPSILAVNPAVPVRNLRELIAYAKANPSKLSYASTGAGTASHIAGEYFKKLAGIDVVHVPYKGSAPALTDLVAGHVAYGFDYTPSVLPHVRSGKLRALAVTGPQRTKVAAEIPTALEEGLSAFNVLTWCAVYAPAGTPEPIVRKIRDSIARAATDPGVIRRMDELGIDIVAGTPEELARFQREEIERWSRFIREANITAQ